jgi:hypothetical protein
MHDCIVTFEHGRKWAPCMVVMYVKSEKIRDAIRKHMETHPLNPLPDNDPDNGVLLSYEDAEEYIPRRRLSEWNDGWDVNVRMDRWTAIALHGYDCGDSVRV